MQYSSLLGRTSLADTSSRWLDRLHRRKDSTHSCRSSITQIRSVKLQDIIQGLLALSDSALGGENGGVAGTLGGALHAEAVFAERDLCASLASIDLDGLGQS
jgi:hypothetical protein